MRRSAARTITQLQKRMENHTLIKVEEHDQYTKGQLERSQLHPTSPFENFRRWFNHARSVPDLVGTPEAVVLSTAELPSGRVSARTVLLKQVDDRGFIIYSNFDTSRKYRDLSTNQHASITIWWEKLERQIRIEGVTERMSPEESQPYYDTRPRGSRLGAWASPQSTPIEDGELARKLAEEEAKFKGSNMIPIPPRWGGLRVVPYYVEFWQGKQKSYLKSRLIVQVERIDYMIGSRTQESRRIKSGRLID